MTVESESSAGARRPFALPLRAVLIIALLCLATLGVALFLRYVIIQNTPIGLACEAGEASFTCKLRLLAIVMFVNECFGWTALIAALVQLWRPNAITFGVGLVFAMLGLVLYNTRVSALAVTLLVLSLARPQPAKA
jgi:Gpi18-like mannosyltransferase